MKAKKLLILLLTAALLTGVCTACRGNNDNQSGQVENVQEFQVDGDGSVTYEFNGAGDDIQQVTPDSDAGK